MTLGEKLQKLRKENNITQEEFADKMEVSRQTVYKWESNQAYPETEKLIAISECYGISCDYLLKNSEDRHDTAVKRRTFFNTGSVLTVLLIVFGLLLSTVISLIIKNDEISDGILNGAITFLVFLFVTVIAYVVLRSVYYSRADFTHSDKIFMFRADSRQILATVVCSVLFAAFALLYYSAPNLLICLLSAIPLSCIGVGAVYIVYIIRYKKRFKTVSKNSGEILIISSALILISVFFAFWVSDAAYYFSAGARFAENYSAIGLNLHFVQIFGIAAAVLIFFAVPIVETVRKKISKLSLICGILSGISIGAGIMLSFVVKQLAYIALIAPLFALAVLTVESKQSGERVFGNVRNAIISFLISLSVVVLSLLGDKSGNFLIACFNIFPALLIIDLFALVRVTEKITLKL